MVKASDTDIVVIAVSVLQALQELGLQQLLVAFGQGQYLRWVPVYDLWCTLAEKSKGMFFFHAFTGCNFVSAFRGKGKKSAWQICDLCDEASCVFSKLTQHPPVVDDEDLKTLERFVVMMYDRSSTAVRSHSSNSICAEAVCEVCCLPGGLHLESVNSMSTRNADSCQLGLDQERRSVADRLDRAPTHCIELPAADQVWMQVGMLLSMQMLPLWSDLHCAGADAKFRSVVVYSSRQQDNK